MGVTWSEFWDMNPNILSAIGDGYKREIEQQNNMAYLSGLYVRDALLATVGNMFKKKGAEDFSYPKEPYDIFNTREERKALEEKSMSEEEKIRQTEQLFRALQIMESNFNLSHGGSGK